MDSKIKYQKMDTKNKLQAFVLMPLCMMVIALLLYFLISLGNTKPQGIVIIILIPLIMCWIIAPAFNKLDFKRMYYKDGGLPLKDKFQRYKGIYFSYGMVVIFSIFVALTMH